MRTLVAMATYSSNRLIMGNEEIDNFFCLIWDIWIFLDIALYKSYDFYSGQIKTLVAMATYCFHRLIIWKFLLFHCG